MEKVYVVLLHHFFQGGGIGNIVSIGIFQKLNLVSVFPDHCRRMLEFCVIIPRSDPFLPRSLKLEKFLLIENKI